MDSEASMVGRAISGRVPARRANYGSTADTAPDLERYSGNEANELVAAYCLALSAKAIQANK